jgi:hypothetical protein
MDQGLVCEDNIEYLKRGGRRYIVGTAKSMLKRYEQALLNDDWQLRQDRVKAHILVCFLTYVLWKMLGQLCRQSGLGDERRRVLEELSRIRLVDVILPTRSGMEIWRRCVSQLSDHQAILRHHLGIHLPSHLLTTEKKMNQL